MFRATQSEFGAYTELLREAGVSVEVMQDTVSPSTPDSIFPNNCFSTHLDRRPDGSWIKSLVIYPMFAPNRRREAAKLMAGRTTLFDRIIDLSYHEKAGLFLEETGSLVLDRERHIAFVCASPRTSEKVLSEWAKLLGYEYFLFDAADGGGTPVGFFQVPIEISHYIHAGCAALFFFTIAINSIFQFTKSRNTMTERKKLRNKVYRFCGYSMLALEAVFIVTRVTPCPGYWAMILEILLLLLFGFAWLVKGRAFPFLNDTEEDLKGGVRE